MRTLTSYWPRTQQAEPTPYEGWIADHPKRSALDTALNQELLEPFDTACQKLIDNYLLRLLQSSDEYNFTLKNLEDYLDILQQTSDRLRSLHGSLGVALKRTTHFPN